MTFAKKAMDEINRLHENSQSNRTDGGVGEEVDVEGDSEEFLWSGKTC